MHTTSTHAVQPIWVRSSGPIIDRYALVAVMAFVYVVILLPLYVYLTTTYTSGKSVHSALQNLMMANPTNKIFWPMLAVIAVCMIALNWSRMRFPPHILFLMAYLGFAGASVLWAFKPEFTFQRFVLQVAVLACVVFPVTLAGRSVDVLRALFCASDLPIFSTYSLSQIKIRSSSMMSSWATRDISHSRESWANAPQSGSCWPFVSCYIPAIGVCWDWSSSPLPSP